MTQWQLLFTVLAVLSMTLGNVVALAQTSMKRMLAYSSIGQAGFVMIGLVCGTEEGFAAMVLYMAAYLFMNLGSLCLRNPVLAAHRQRSHLRLRRPLPKRSSDHPRPQPLPALVRCGIPPMLGFLRQDLPLLCRLG